MAAGGRATQYGMMSKGHSSQDDSLADRFADMTCDDVESDCMHGETAFPRGTGAPEVRGRRYISCESQMCNAGVSTAAPLRHGRGRRSIQEEDHRVTHEDHMGTPMPARARKSFAEKDNVRDQVFQSSEGTQRSRGATEDMKQAVRDCLMHEHGIVVYDEARWAAITAEQNGCTWKLETLTEQRLSTCREGRCARVIADKFSMLGAQELKHFGLRFAGKGEAGKGEALSASPVRRAKGSPLEDSPTLASPGVHTALGCDASRLQGDKQMSCSRRDPQEKMRRYIDSGRDHFQSFEVASHGASGTNGDMGFCDGIERGIGHGRRQVGTAQKCNLFGSGVVQ
jgi:hypothetical protein